MLRSALGYAHRQRGPLTRFFDDGRLALTNDAAERQLRRVAVGRKVEALRQIEQDFDAANLKERPAASTGGDAK